MTERERWIVYPLLFLALGAVLRDKLVDRTTTKSIICQELLVVDEQPLGGEPILLAKIGRTEPVSAGSPSTGHLIINGQLEVVDPQLVHTLVRVGRTAPTKDVPSRGFVFVNGAINAAQYAYQGVPFAPALQAVMPGVTLPDLMRAWQQTQQRPDENAPAPQPPEKKPDETSPPSPPLAEPAENR